MQRALEARLPKGGRIPRIPVLLAVICVLSAGCGDDPDERRASIYRLKAEPSPDNVTVIRALLEDDDRDVRATSLNALVELAVPDAEQIALRGLDDADGFVRATAAKLVGDIGDPDNAGALARMLLEDPDPIARQRAAEAVVRLGGEEALQSLTQALADPGERVRRAAIDGLVELGPSYAREELGQLLNSDPVWEIRAEAAHALGLIEGDEVVADLERAGGDPNEFVRAAAANALKFHAKLPRPAAAGGDSGE